MKYKEKLFKEDWENLKQIMDGEKNLDSFKGKSPNKTQMFYT